MDGGKYRIPGHLSFIQHKSPELDSDATDEKKENDNNQAAYHTGRMLLRCVLQKKQDYPAREESFKKRPQTFQSPGENLDERVYVRSLMGYRRNRRELHQPAR